MAILNAPDIITNPAQHAAAPTTNHLTDELQAAMAAQRPVQHIPVWQPTAIGTTSEAAFNRGWIQRYLKFLSPPPYQTEALTEHTQPTAHESPEIPYVAKSYGSLIRAAANPPATQNRPAYQLTAPDIIQA